MEVAWRASAVLLHELRSLPLGNISIDLASSCPVSCLWPVYAGPWARCWEISLTRVKGIDLDSWPLVGAGIDLDPGALIIPHFSRKIDQMGIAWPYPNYGAVTAVVGLNLMVLLSLGPCICQTLFFRKTESWRGWLRVSYLYENSSERTESWPGWEFPLPFCTIKSGNSAPLIWESQSQWFLYQRRPKPQGAFRQVGLLSTYGQIRCKTQTFSGLGTAPPVKSGSSTSRSKGTNRLFNLP